MFSVGSIIGGLTVGQLAPRKSSFALFSLILVLGFGLTFVAPTNPVWMSFCFVFRWPRSSTLLGMLGAVISFALDNSETAEAYGWASTGQMVGYSVAAAISGFVIDAVSPTAALLVALAFAVATSIVAFGTINDPRFASHHQKETK
jgi:predicted MFS family arabinose efflux permease